MKVYTKRIGCLRVKYFTLPVGDMNSPSYNKFTEGIDFFWQVTQTLGRALKSWKITCQNQFLIAENDVFDDIKVGETILVIDNIHYLHF